MKYSSFIKSAKTDKTECLKLIDEAISNEILDDYLYIASYLGVTTLFKKLLLKGASIFRKSKAFNDYAYKIFDSKDKEPLFLLALENISDENKKYLTKFDDNNDFTPLSFAVFHSLDEAFFKIVSFNVNLNQVNKDNISLFYDACKIGNIKISKFLLHKLPDSHVYGTNKYGISPLKVALVKNKIDTIIALFNDGYDLLKNEDLFSFLTLCVGLENYALLEKISSFNIDYSSISVGVIPDIIIEFLSSKQELSERFSEELIFLKKQHPKSVYVLEKSNRKNIYRNPLYSLDLFEHGIDFGKPNVDSCNNVQETTLEALEEQPQTQSSAIFGESDVEETKPSSNVDNEDKGITKFIFEPDNQKPEEILIQNKFDDVSNESKYIPKGKYLIVIGDLALNSNSFNTILAKNGIRSKYVKCYDYKGRGFDFDSIINSDNIYGIILGPTAHKITSVSGKSLKQALTEKGIKFIDLIKRRITKTSLEYALGLIRLQICNNSF